MPNVTYSPNFIRSSWRDSFTNQQQQHRRRHMPPARPASLAGIGAGGGFDADSDPLEGMADHLSNLDDQARLKCTDLVNNINQAASDLQDIKYGVFSVVFAVYLLIIINLAKCYLRHRPKPPSNYIPAYRQRLGTTSGCGNYQEHARACSPLPGEMSDGIEGDGNNNGETDPITGEWIPHDWQLRQRRLMRRKGRTEDVSPMDGRYENGTRNNSEDFTSAGPSSPFRPFADPYAYGGTLTPVLSDKETPDSRKDTPKTSVIAKMSLGRTTIASVERPPITKSKEISIDEDPTTNPRPDRPLIELADVKQESSSSVITTQPHTSSVSISHAPKTSVTRTYNSTTVVQHQPFSNKSPTPPSPVHNLARPQTSIGLIDHHDRTPLPVLQAQCEALTREKVQSDLVHTRPFVVHELIDVHGKQMGDFAASPSRARQFPMRQSLRRANTLHASMRRHNVHASPLTRRHPFATPTRGSPQSSIDRAALSLVPQRSDPYRTRSDRTEAVFQQKLNQLQDERRLSKGLVNVTANNSNSRTQPLMGATTTTATTRQTITSNNANSAANVQSENIGNGGQTTQRGGISRDISCISPVSRDRVGSYS